jgi:hypothetical protein
MDTTQQLDWTRIISLLDNTNTNLEENVLDTDIYVYAKKVSNVLMARDKSVTQEWPWNETWIDSMANHENRQIAKKFRIWLSVGTQRQRTFYLLYLANIDFGATRFFLEYLALSNKHVPDLEYFLNNIISLFFGKCPVPKLNKLKSNEISHTEDSGATALRDFLKNKEQLLNWLTDERVNVPVMGGWRNVLLGIHRGDFAEFAPWDDSEEYFDLGGGHHTPWLSEEVSKPITTLDIVAPTELNHIKLRKLAIGADGQQYPVNLKDVELQKYLEKLNQQKYLYFDLLNDEFPFRKKLTIFSTGFLTSTMSLPKELLNTYQDVNFKLTPKLQAVCFNIAGIIKCLTLVKQGADLELITASRPSAYPMINKMVHLRWVNGLLVYKKTMPHNNARFSLEIKEKRREFIRP